MTVTLEALRRSRPDVLRQVAVAVARERGLLGEVWTELVAGRVLSIRWTGPAAVAADVRGDRLLRDVSARYRGVATTCSALGRAADDLEMAQSLVRLAERHAADGGGRLDADGRLIVPCRLGGAGDSAVLALHAREQERLHWEVATLVARALEQSETADRELARSLSSVVSDNACFSSPTEGALLRPPSLPSGRPAEWLAYASAAWWQSLSSTEREWVLREHPEWVGPRDGIPAWTRHAANFVLLGRAERAAEAVLEERRAGRRPHGPHGRPPGDDAEERVADLVALRRTLAQADGIPRQLLRVDTSGPLVTAVVTVGDVERADHVATYVAGFTTTVREVLPRLDGDFSRLRSMGNTQLGKDGLAVVSWLGYPAPQAREAVSLGGRSVLSDDIANAYAPRLASFVDGLDASRDRPAHQTLWAHSYGSVLAGKALMHNTGVDDVVLFGSPGVAFSGLTQVGLKPGSLNVLKAYHDFVADSEWFDRDPAKVPGASLLSTDWSKPGGVNLGLPSSGHTEYLKPGSTSERNLVAVAIGRPDLRVLLGQ